MNPNVKKVNVCITLTPIVIAMAKNKCFRDGKSLSAKIDEMLAAYVCEDFDLGMPASWNAMQSNDNAEVSHGDGSATPTTLKP